MLSLNERAAALFAQAEAAAELLEVAVTRLPNGAAVLDAGVEAPGSLEAGRLFAEVCLGGLGDVRFRQLELGDLTLPGVEVNVNHPVTACMASQYAGWAVNVPATESSKKYFAMGSGPARVLYAGEPLFERPRVPRPRGHGRGARPRVAHPADGGRRRVGGAEVRRARRQGPPAGRADSQPRGLGADRGTHRRDRAAQDCTRSASTSAPCAPASAPARWRRSRPTTSPRSAAPTTACSTAAVPGTRSTREDAAVEAVIEGLPSSASRDYGAPFGELFKRYEGDFYKIDPLLFSPAEVALTNARSGRTFRAGGVNPGVLAGSLLG